MGEAGMAPAEEPIPMPRPADRSSAAADAIEATMGARLEDAMGKLFSHGYLLLSSAPEDRQTPLESDGAPVDDRLQPRDGAPDDFAADRDPLMSRRQAHFDRRSGQQPHGSVDQRARRRDVDQPRMMAGRDARREHAVVVDAAASPVVASFLATPHSGLH